MIRLVIAVNEVNKRSVRLFFEAVLTEGRLELIDDLIARDYLGHVSCVERPVIGPAGLRRFVCSRPRDQPCRGGVGNETGVLPPAHEIRIRGQEILGHVAGAVFDRVDEIEAQPAPE